MQPQSDYLPLIYSHPRWEELIKPMLKQMVQKTISAQDLIRQLKNNQFFSYTIYRQTSKKEMSSSSLKILYKMFRQELKDIFSLVAEFVLSLENNQPKIPIFKSNTAKEHTFLKSQILCIVCLMSLLLIMHPDEKIKTRFNMLKDFGFIFSEQAYKTKCIMEYLKQELTIWKSSEQYSQEKMTIKKYKEEKSVEELIKDFQQTKMNKAIIGHDKESIQDYDGDVKIDFANKYIGGGSLRAGCVQEEIMFANRPQLYTPMIFCEVMTPNESLSFTGFKKYFKNKGYAQTCSYDGKQTKKYEFDDKNRAKQYIVAIDALHFPRKNDRSQFDVDQINRQLLKAYVGFKGSEGKRIITGNWGCGAFNGDVRLKFIIQWIAASMAKKQIIYIPFGQNSKLNQKKFLEFLESKTIFQVYQLLCKKGEKIKTGKENIFQIIMPK